MATNAWDAGEVSFSPDGTEILLHRRGGIRTRVIRSRGGCGTQLVEINTDGSDETAITSRLT